MLDPHKHIERAPILRIFGDHATRMATLLRRRPSLLARVTYAPRSALHGLGAFLFLAPEAHQDDATVAEMLDEQNPRDLLRFAIPNAPPKLYRALDRAGDCVRQQSFYVRLAVLCGGPLGDLLLSGGPLNEARFDWAEKLLQADPAVFRLRAVLTRTSQIEAVDALVSYLRAHGAFEDGDLKMPDGAGLAAVMRRLQRGLDRVEAPAPGFKLAPPFQIIRTVSELREAGKRLKNCVSDVRSYGAENWFRLGEGRLVYITSQAPPMLAAVRQVAPRLWHLEELEGLENELVEPDSRELFVGALRSAGVRLTGQTPFRALRSLCTPNRLDDCEEDRHEGDDSVDDAMAA
jgi:hypothetical protein